MIDIGRHLEMIIPKLSLFDNDSAALQFVANEIALIKQECSKRPPQKDINFTCLEFFRSMERPHAYSFMENYNMVFSKIMDWEDGARACRMSLQFLEDPSALREHRLHTFRR